MFTPLVDVLLPAVCPSCGGLAGVDGRTRLCPGCDAQVRRLLVAMDCPPPIAGAWTLGRYAGPLGAMVRRGKYRPDVRVFDELGARLAVATRGRLPRVDVVTSVPLPLRRRLQRSFDQAERLARPVARSVGAPYQHLLRRVDPSEQAGRRLADRARHAPQAFRVRRYAVPPRVLLVDDVFTTGATTRACAEELILGGASRVYVVVVAHSHAR